MIYATGIEICVGDFVTWIKQHSGGYGYTSAIPAYVVKIAAKRIAIATERLDGTWQPRWVQPGSLTLRTATHG